MCWESPEEAGGFLSIRALEVGDRLLERIEQIRPAGKAKWSQSRITRWQNETFGDPRSNLGIAVRANVEMGELLRCLAKDDGDQHAREEVADVIITLCRLVTRLGGNIVRDVDAKMEVNVSRTWSLGPDGHGDHIDPPSTAPEPDSCYDCGSPDHRYCARS